MPEMDVERKLVRTFKEPAQIYKEKLEELFEKNQELLSQNETLRTENQDLLARNQELSVQLDDLLRKHNVLSRKIRNVRHWILLAVMAVILAVFFCVRMLEYEKRFADEQNLRVKMTQAYETAAKEGEALASLQGELAKLCGGTYGSYSSFFYAEESLSVLHVGQTRTVRLHMPTYFANVSASPSDEEALDAVVVNFDSRNGCGKLEITAHRAGVYTVNLSGWLWSFDIMVLVLEE